MTLENDPIWVLDSDPGSVLLYQQTLGLRYPLQVFNDFKAFASAFNDAPHGQPKLLVADPETAKGSFSQLFQSLSTPGGARSLPETIIVSRLDDLELIRFFLRVGARDYILKPLRPNELVAKVERSFLRIDSNASRILRNDIDGLQVNDLTFREHQILTVLLNMPDRAAAREFLYDAVWTKTAVNRKTLDVHLFNLRRKLRPIGYDIICQGQIFRLQQLAGG
ncbi:MAG TPA: winged helix-turn-helix domain-containing protein [Bdellovibrionales bacterium]|jgi:DNA-binding response OmpR family regulator|nr:winged helix-turn-helix domain-containing protein [Bdellovibrionales bacterium]